MMIPEKKVDDSSGHGGLVGVPLSSSVSRLGLHRLIEVVTVFLLRPLKNHLFGNWLLLDQQ
jgi:hypothetical protein